MTLLRTLLKINIQNLNSKNLTLKDASKILFMYQVEKNLLLMFTRKYPWHSGGFKIEAWPPY